MRYGEEVKAPVLQNIGLDQCDLVIARGENLARQLRHAGTGPYAGPDFDLEFQDNAF